MSLIVDINPVPWKILDLVRARIIKNRAKKSKKGMDWSKEALRREMSLQSVSLLSRKRDEPSFTAGTDRFYVIYFGGYLGQFIPGGGYMQIPIRFTVKINNQLQGEVNFLPLINQSQIFYFTSAAGDKDFDKIVKPGFPEIEQQISIFNELTISPPSPTEIPVLELSDITSSNQGAAQVVPLVVLIMTIGFYDYDEDRFYMDELLALDFPIEQNPGKVTHVLDTWYDKNKLRVVE